MSADLPPRALILTAQSAAYASVEALIEAAAGTGCEAVSFWGGALLDAGRRGLKPAQIGRMAADRGLVIHDVDAVVLDAGDEPVFDAPPADWMIEQAVAMGARCVNTIVTGPPGIAEARCAELFAAAARSVADAGLLPYLEFLPAPISPVQDLAAAWRVVDRAGVAQAHILLDTWHFVRGGSTLEQLDAVGAERIVALQVSDVAPHPHPDLLHETLHARLLPGEGVVPWAGILGRLGAAGWQGPFSIEVVSDELAALGTREAARRCVDAVRGVLDAHLPV